MSNNKRYRSGEKVEEYMKNLSEAQKKFADDLLEGVKFNTDYYSKLSHRDQSKQSIMVTTDYPEVLKCLYFMKHLVLMVRQFKPNAVLQFPSWAFSRDDTPIMFKLDEVLCVEISVVCY